MSSVPITVSAVSSGFFVLSPCRILDTRDAVGVLGGPSIPAFSDRQFPASGICGIPSTAKSLVANLTVVNPPSSGFLRTYAGDVTLPVSTSVAFNAGSVRGNNVVLRLSVNGGTVFAIRNDSNAPVDVILDVSGYFE